MILKVQKLLSHTICIMLRIFFPTPPSFRQLLMKSLLLHTVPYIPHPHPLTHTKHNINNNNTRGISCNSHTHTQQQYGVVSSTYNPFQKKKNANPSLFSLSSLAAFFRSRFLFPLSLDSSPNLPATSPIDSASR